MKIYINSEVTEIPFEVKNVSQLVGWKKLPAATTAVAYNGKLVKRENWEGCFLEENADILLISAAFGG